MGLQPAMEGAGASKTLRERAVEIPLGDLDRVSDQIERVIDISPNLAGKIRVHEELLNLSMTNQFAYTLVLKCLKDIAKGFENATHSMNATMSDSEIARSVMYNTGAWQALMLAINQLQPETLGKNLDAMRRTTSKM